MKCYNYKGKCNSLHGIRASWWVCTKSCGKGNTKCNGVGRSGLNGSGHWWSHTSLCTRYYSEHSIIASGWAQLMFKLIMSASVAAMNRELCILNVKVRQRSSRIPRYLSVQYINSFIETSKGKLLGVVGVMEVVGLGWTAVLLCHWRPTANVNCSPIAMMI